MTKTQQVSFSILKVIINKNTFLAWKKKSFVEKNNISFTHYTLFNEK